MLSCASLLNTVHTGQSAVLGLVVGLRNSAEPACLGCQTGPSCCTGCHWVGCCGWDMHGALQLASRGVSGSPQEP